MVNSHLRNMEKEKECECGDCKWKAIGVGCNCPCHNSSVEVSKCNCGHSKERHFFGVETHCKEIGCKCEEFKPSLSDIPENTEVTITKEKGIRFNVWHSPNEKNNYFNHPAPFPEKLAEDHILSWSNEGDIILDPMAGSGTTLKMAKKNNRNYIGIEISEEYIDIINKRLTSNLAIK